MAMISFINDLSVSIKDICESIFVEIKGKNKKTGTRLRSNHRDSPETRTLLTPGNTVVVEEEEKEKIETIGFNDYFIPIHELNRTKCSLIFVGFFNH